jgi:hypothetical protein
MQLLDQGLDLVVGFTGDAGVDDRGNFVSGPSFGVAAAERDGLDEEALLDVEVDGGTGLAEVLDDGGQAEQGSELLHLLDLQEASKRQPVDPS